MFLSQLIVQREIHTDIDKEYIKLVIGVLANLEIKSTLVEKINVA